MLHSLRTPGTALAAITSEPPFAPEQLERNDGGYQHQHQRQGISEHPFELRHVLEIHAVGGRDQNGWHQADRDDQEYLDDLVLLQIDQVERSVKQEVGFFAR